MAKGVDSSDFESWLAEKMDALGLDAEVGDPTLNTTSSRSSSRTHLHNREPGTDLIRCSALVVHPELKSNRCALLIVK